MKRLTAISCLSFWLMLTGSVHAEGLIYKLGDDGTWAKFDLEAKGTGLPDGDITVSGTLKISSVGSREISDEECRLIEIATDGKRNNQAFTDVDKLLIPEKLLTKNGAPIKHIIRAWHKSSTIADGKVLDTQDFDRQTAKYFLPKLTHYLHGPFENPQMLKSTVVESKLGPLECDGILARERGPARFANGTSDTQYTIRIHKDAPFGVVTWEAETKTEDGGKTVGTMTIKLKLSDLGNDAKTAIPDAK
jgi:hypothetical protein